MVAKVIGETLPYFYQRGLYTMRLPYNGIPEKKGFVKIGLTSKLAKLELPKCGFSLMLKKGLTMDGFIRDFTM